MKPQDRPTIDRIEWVDQPQTFEDYFGNLKILSLNILVDRQRKYGPENITKGGLYGLVTRMTDKLERLKNQLHGRLVAGVIEIEEIRYPSDEDRFDGNFDLGNYADIDIALKDGVWGTLPLRENHPAFSGPRDA